MPNTKQNLIGKQFGHLTVIAKLKECGTQNEYKWLCRCDCGDLSDGTKFSTKVVESWAIRESRKEYNTMFGD